MIAPLATVSQTVPGTPQAAPAAAPAGVESVFAALVEQLGGAPVVPAPQPPSLLQTTLQTSPQTSPQTPPPTSQLTAPQAGPKQTVAPAPVAIDLKTFNIQLPPRQAIVPKAAPAPIKPATVTNHSAPPQRPVSRSAPTPAPAPAPAPVVAAPAAVVAQAETKAPEIAPAKPETTAKPAEAPQAVPQQATPIPVAAPVPKRWTVSGAPAPAPKNTGTSAVPVIAIAVPAPPPLPAPAPKPPVQGSSDSGDGGPKPAVTQTQEQQTTERLAANDTVLQVNIKMPTEQAAEPEPLPLRQQPLRSIAETPVQPVAAPVAASAATPPASVSSGHSASATQVRPAEEVPAPRSGVLQEPVTREPAAAAPLKSLSLEFSPDGAGDVRLRVSERAGEVHISLHSSDVSLGGKLHEGVQDLVGNLSKAGYDAEAWTPGQGHQGNQQQQEQRKPQQPKSDGTGSEDFGTIYETQPLQEVS